MLSNIPNILTMTQAAKRMAITIPELQRLINAGKINLVRLPNGELGVSEQEIETTKNQFKHLRGKPITVSDACKKYNLVQRTLSRWVHKGYIAIIKPGYRMTLDEADVAYCAEVYVAHGKSAGARIFDEDGKPYKVKWPSLAQYRKKKKQSQ